MNAYLALNNTPNLSGLIPGNLHKIGLTVDQLRSLHWIREAGNDTFVAVADLGNEHIDLRIGISASRFDEERRIIATDGGPQIDFVQAVPCTKPLSGRTGELRGLLIAA